jgi:hypothetical protein
VTSRVKIPRGDGVWYTEGIYINLPENWLRAAGWVPAREVIEDIADGGHWDDTTGDNKVIPGELFRRLIASLSVDADAKGNDV